MAVEQSPHLAFVDDDIESEIDLDSDLSDLPEAKSVKGLAEKRVARYVNSLPLSSKTPDGLRFGAKRSQITWTRSSPLPPPPNRSIWPRPPPPPRAPSPAYYSPIIDVSSRIKKSSTQERFSGEVSQSTSIATLSDTAESVDISARSLNFTDRLELTWSERRRYAAKEMERVWHEVDSDSRYPGAVSAHEYAEALLGHVFRVTAARRQLLEAPDNACLKAATQTLASASRQREVASPAVKVSSGGETTSSKSHLRPSSLGLKPTLYSPKELAVRQALLADSLARLPGKLDHATVVVYEVGVFRGDESEVYESGSRSCLSPHSNSSEQRLSNCCNGQFD
ncbi:unnamed protein product [Protopolystoma xenopodis]|uniref:Uncharacterized protein n=1 Tax=Protopolystoma xenopodis TaxID=117903 RepID=A0A448XPW6_9PLAT|nr:unnamed protein product [Protopolystoma xenopodis]